MLTENELIEILKKCNDCYYNTGEYYELTEDECNDVMDTLQIPCQKCMSDPMYDEVYNHTKKLYPNNHFFKEVGIKERSMKKVKLPFVMGSMTELHSGELSGWINPLDQYCCSSKLDGISCGMVYKKGNLWRAYTRGDGYEGQDITTTVMRFGEHFPKKIPFEEDLLVRGEIIVPKKDFQSMKEELKQETGKDYANIRNSCAGCLNSKISPKSFVKYAHLVCYHIEGDFVRESAIFEILQKFGFETAKWEVLDGENITEEMMTARNIDMKENYEYEVDGTILTENLRVSEGYDTGTINPKMSKKYKVGCINNYAESKVIGITWQISKDGYAKPVIQIEPVPLDGVIVSNVTGNNYKNVIDNKISIGSTIKLHRSGLVIPFIDEVVEYAENEDYNLPNMELFKDNGVDLVFNDKLWKGNGWTEFYNEMLLQKVIYFCQKMNVDFAGEGNLRRLLRNNIIDSYTANLTNPGVYTLLLYSQTYMNTVLGVNGDKLYESLHKNIQNMSKAQFFDALGTFGRGIGEKKLQKLLDKYNTLDLTFEQVLSTEGFAEITSQQYIEHLDNYKIWLNIAESSENKLSFKNENAEIKSSDLQGLVVVFTGIRDKEMEANIIANDGKVASSLTKDVNLVITKDVNSSSSKITKAKEKGIKIISYEDAKNLYA